MILYFIDVMRKRILFCVYLMLLSTCIHAQTNTFKVMSWNILHGANDIKNGKENVVRIIKEIDPDVILMIETNDTRTKR